MATKRSSCIHCSLEHHERKLRVEASSVFASQRIERMEKFRAVKHVEPSKDQSALIGILLDTEARDITRSMLESYTTQEAQHETSTELVTTITYNADGSITKTVGTRTIAHNAPAREPLDDLYGKILFHQIRMELEVSYACQYEAARMRGYRKQFATFIQSRQSLRDGSTLDENKTLQSVFSFASKGSRAIVLEHAPNALHASWNDPDEDTDYVMLFDTSRDARWDEEHEKRAEAWQRRNGL